MVSLGGVSCKENWLPGGLPALEQAWALPDDLMNLYTQKVEQSSPGSGGEVGGCQSLMGTTFHVGKIFKKSCRQMVRDGRTTV